MAESHLPAWEGEWERRRRRSARSHRYSWRARSCRWDRARRFADFS